MTTNFIDVLEFHRKMGLPDRIGQQPALLSDVEMRRRVDFMMEELMELQGASNVGQLDVPESVKLRAMAEIFDGLLDLVYVAMGTAVMMGLPWQDGWYLVQQANMQKLRDPSQDTEHHRGVVKPPGWRHPDIEGLLREVMADLNPERISNLKYGYE